MEEILKEWLKRRLNIQTQWDTDVGNEIKNGSIIARILHSYNIINDEKTNLILKSNENKHIKSNWSLLREWLRDVEITLSDEDLENIKKGSKSNILRLFYHLFLFLDKKDRSDFIKHERKMTSTLIEKPANRFKVKVLNKEENVIEDILAKPLLNEKLFIDWQRKKADEVKEMYKEIRRKYLKMTEKPFEPMVDHIIHKVPDRNQKDIEQFDSKYPNIFRNYTYDELMVLENRNKLNPHIVDSEWTKEYMNNLFSRMNKKSDSEEFQKQMIQSITTDAWNSSIAESESSHDAELANEVMKLSQFEKQMCTQIMETKQQVRNLVNNRIEAEKEFANQREHQFNVFIDSVKEDINSGLIEMDFEKQRNQTLHLRLFAEKMKRKRKLYFQICYETVLSLVDYATKYGYYKQLIGDIPDKFIHEWKLLYFKQQPIFDILTPIDDIVIENDENHIEEINDLTLENIRQECLNETEFTEYIEYLYPWTLDILLSNYDSESEERKYEHKGHNILAHVVYTLLEMKYPLPPNRPPANLPYYNIKSLVIDVPSMSIDLAMQKLLNKQNIFVLRVESCVDFCLKRYKTEMIGSVDISLEFEKITENIKEEITRGPLKSFMSQRKSKRSKSELLFSTQENNTKQTQTPKAIPEENIVLSKAANLGKQAFEILSSGESLPSDLIVYMLAEFIKEQKDIAGFVIINFPNTYTEARILEEIFSGKRPPNDSEYDYNDEALLEEEVETNCDDIIQDPLKEFRKSKILKFDKISTGDTFTTYFSSYIKLKKSEKIENEVFIWDLTKENSEAIDRFYAAVGINYSMYYENIIDKMQLALLCRYVIGDYEFPLKSDDVLFGTNVLDELEFPALENKKPKLKVIKTDISNGKNSKEVNSPSTQTETQNNIKDDLKDNATNEKSSQKPSTFSTHNITWKDAEEILAGDDNWEYSKIQISKEPALALASCWEEIEKCYVNDVKQLLLSKRLQMNCLVPYTTFTVDKMKQIVMLPSPKQDMVCKFQEDYNNLEDDWRENNVTRNEWHCRVRDLQNRLYNICDERKSYSEQQKHSIICENWVCDELIILANTYVSLIQTELNRFILSYQILHDYYIVVINKSLPQRLLLKELNKFVRDSDEIASMPKTKTSEEKYRLVKEAFLELQLKSIKIDSNNNPLTVFIDDNVKLALRYVQETSEHYKTLVSYETNDLVMKLQNTSSSSLRKKLEKDSKIIGQSFEGQKFEYLKCMEEWKLGCVGETNRVNFRINVLQKKCYEDMQIFCDEIFKAYKNIQNYIDENYLNEIKAVDCFTKYLQMAIELNQKIPENLLLEGDSFSIDPNVLHIPTTSTTPEIPEKAMGDMEFKLCQLALLRDMFKIVAPTGIAIQQAFIYSLQDFVLFGKESCKGPLFPLMWRRIDPDKIPQFVFSIFGDNLYIDWRDFLIFCLDIPFPTTDELLDIRKKLRCQESEFKELVEREIFINTSLWFENKILYEDKSSQLRNTLLKHFLFELFEVSKDVMNYTALLLAFCKGKDPKDGFAKALALALGKRVCHLTQECEEAVDKLIKAKKLKDKIHNQVCEDINQFLVSIVYNVLDICTGTTITELKDNNMTKDGKKGRGKISGRSKTSTRSSHMGMNKPVFSPGKSEIKMIFTNYTVKADSEYNNKKPKESNEENQADHSDTIYSISRSIILKVLEACVPWHFGIIDQDKCTEKTVIVEIIDRLEMDTEDKTIYVSKFLAEPKICKFLYKIKRFSEPNLYEEVSNILEDYK